MEERGRRERNGGGVGKVIWRGGRREKTERIGERERRMREEEREKTKGRAERTGRADRTDRSYGCSHHNIISGSIPVDPIVKEWKRKSCQKSIGLP